MWYFLLFFLSTQKLLKTKKETSDMESKWINEQFKKGVGKKWIYQSSALFFESLQSYEIVASHKYTKQHKESIIMTVFNNQSMVQDNLNANCLVISYMKCYKSIIS